MSKKNRFGNGLVYSTNPDYLSNEEDEIETPLPSEQRLKVVLESKGRGGKTVTLVKGFIGKDEDGEALCKMLKQKCGTGGSFKEGELVIQGSEVKRITDALVKEGYKL